MRTLSMLKAGLGLGLSLALVTSAWADLKISIGVRETNAAGGPYVGVGNDGGIAGGIEFVDLDQQTLVLDGTWQQFTFNFSTADFTAFAGTTANSILEGDFGVLDHIRIRNSGGLTHEVKLWIDDVTNTYIPPLGGPQVFNFGSFEGYNDGDEVIFQEPGFSGSTNSNLVNSGLSAVDSSKKFSGDSSYGLTFQFVDDADNRWIRLNTFNTPNLPNPMIRFDQQATISFWIMGIPEPGSMALLAVGALISLGRRKRK